MENKKFKNFYTDEYFKNRFEGVDKKREISYLQEYNRILNFIDKGKVLDIGCGMGNFLQIFSDTFEKYGIEISDYAANEARKKDIKIIDYGFKESFFDLIIFRGVFQHLHTPLLDLQNSLKMLKNSGYIVFLATPNSNSVYYKLFNTLPMLDPKRNFVIPSDIMLKQILQNFGCDVLEIYFPYLKSPYSNVFLDHIKFIGKCLGLNNKFAFWRNSMEIYARKRIDNE